MMGRGRPQPPRRPAGVPSGGQFTRRQHDEADISFGDEPSLEDVLERAAELQRLVPGAVLVGGSAAALHAGHRRSFDHDHVVTDLADRYDSILEHLESLGEWSTARVAAGKIILGELGGIETGVRQMMRTRPLETEAVTIRGKTLTVPTLPETLRVKAWLAVQRNQTRDYIDIAALSDKLGLDEAATVLGKIDDYYEDVNQRPESVATQLVRQLAEPRPRDAETTERLAEYKGLDSRWHSWDSVRAVLADVAGLIAGGAP